MIREEAEDFMDFIFGFFRRKKTPVEKEGICNLEIAFVATNFKAHIEDIYKNIFIDIIQSDLSLEFPLFLTKKSPYTDQNNSFALFELGMFIMYRFYFLLYSIGTGETIRSAGLQLCSEKLFEFVKAPKDLLIKQFSLRLARYQNLVEYFLDKNLQGKEILEHVNLLGYSLIQRAINSNDFSDWQMDEKTVVPPLGLTCHRQIMPELKRMETTFILPMLDGLKKCKGVKHTILSELEYL